MEPYLNRPFEMLFDLTMFKQSVEIPAHWLNQFFQLIFNEMNDYLVTLYIYNPNLYFQKYLKKMPRLVVNKLIKRVHFAVTLADLHDKIAPYEVKLPKETLDLEKAPSNTFYPVTRITNLKSSSVPVTLKIAQEHVQIITARKQEVWDNVHTILNDVYHISEIDDMAPLPSSKQENNDMIIKYDQGKSSMVLSTSKRDAILAVSLFVPLAKCRAEEREEELIVIF